MNKLLFVRLLLLCFLFCSLLPLYSLTAWGRIILQQQQAQQLVQHRPRMERLIARVTP